MGLRNLVIALLASFLFACGADEKKPGEPAGDEIAARLVEVRKQLASLGYVNTVPVAPGEEEAGGVVAYDPAAAYPGLNLFNSREKSVARLITMRGREVHRWESEARGRNLEWFVENLPNHTPGYMYGWNHIELVDGGDLLAIGTHHMLARLDWSSRVRWKLDISAHHDLDVASNGDIYVLTDAARSTQLDGKTITFQDNLVTVLSPDGEIKRTLSFFDAFATPELQERLRKRLLAIPRAQERQLAIFRERSQEGDAQVREILRLYGDAVQGDIASDSEIKNVLLHVRAEDIFHSNSIQVLERDNPGLWRKGDLLVSILRFDTIAVIDHQSGHVVWTWGEGVLEEQHHATWLDDGMILIFDNGVRRESSRILKMDPQTGEIVWEYEGDPPSSFFSRGRGGVQALANGNVLIAETDKGRAFEVSTQGEIVWEYYNENLYLENQESKRGAIYRMKRIEPSRVEGLLTPAAAGGSDP